MENLQKLLHRNRSYRRFDESVPVPASVLTELVELTRACPSAANLQPLKYVLSSSPETNEAIFSTLAWAGYLKQWPGPGPGERPTAYIVILRDETLSRDSRWDEGIVSHTMLLGANQRGFGGCIIGSINKDRLRPLLDLPEQLKIRLVLALGKPAERVLIDDLAPGGDHRYWREADGTHHVPKRTLAELIV